MSKNRPTIDLGMTGYEELFMNDQQRADNRKPKVEEVPITELFSFKEHPFKVKEDEELERLKESIRESGVLVPALARPRDGGGYELVSGHRRMAACKALGLETMPVIIRDLTDEESIITMVDANLQREHILPSEKAFAYKMKMEALKKQGKRSDLTSGQVGPKLTVDEIADSESASQVKRYIRLTNLIPKLLDLVDKGSIALTTAVELSYLKPHEQEWVQDAIEYEECTPSLSQAGRLKKASQERTLTKEDVLFLMQEEKPNQRAVIKIARSELDRYFPKDYTDEQIKTEIMKSLDNQRRERLRRERDSR